MISLRPGYPPANPLLQGVAALLAGEPLEQQLLKRDLALPDALAFSVNALEAAGWLEEAGEFGALLVEQSCRAFRRLDKHTRLEMLAKARRGAGTSPLASQMASAWAMAERGAHS